MAESMAEAQRLRLAVGRFARRLRQLFLDDSGLAALELGVLQRLHLEGPLSPGHLARLEAVTGPAIAQTLRRLERDELVTTTPNPADRRGAVVAITRGGTTQLNSRKSDVVACIDSALDRSLTPAERRQLIRAIPLLEKVSQAL